MARYRFKNLPTTATAISRKIQRIIPQDSQVRFPRAVSQASSPTPAERKSFQREAPDRSGNLSLTVPGGTTQIVTTTSIDSFPAKNLI